MTTAMTTATTTGPTTATGTATTTATTTATRGGTETSYDGGWRRRTPLTVHLDHLTMDSLRWALLHRTEEPVSDHVPGEVSRLTERELTVLRAMATGASNAEIAADLFLSVATVKTHVARVLSKLGLRDRTQAVVFAYESRLVVPR
jgi:DNA-binding CsgD family transcriptional regulator